MSQERRASGSNALRTPLSHVSTFFHNFSDLFRQAPLSLLFCSFTGLLAGIGLSFMTGLLQTLPGLIILIPPAIGMRGNIYSALVSRLGTSMHLGLYSPSLKRGGILFQNASSSLVLTLVLSVILGFLVKMAAYPLGPPNGAYISLHGFVLISVVAGLISGLVLLAIALLVSIIGYQRNWDLDNMSSPIITSAGDVITIPALFLAALLVLKLERLAPLWSWGGWEWFSPVSLISVFFIAAALLAAFRGLRSEDRALRRILIESIPMLFICGLIDTLAGVTLDIRLEHLIALPAMFIVIPPFLGESNALGGILSSRLSSMLHIGTVEPRSLPDRLVSANFMVIYCLALIVFLVVGGTAYAASRYLQFATPAFPKMLAIALLGGLFCTTFLNLASYYIAILSFRFGLDPDNDTIPLITCLTDVVGVFSLLFAMYLLL
ncbi:MAG: magnesium transporter [Methanomicrobia archaeon]|nr:magnesium transporter [Methanomicrobia archaeon]